MDTHATIKVLLETGFLLGPCKGIKRRTIEERTDSCNEGSSGGRESPFKEYLSPEAEE
jgi:hypothetical protein